MKLKKYLLPSMILVLLGQGQLIAQKYIKVIDATSTPWSAGTAHGGSGTRYVIKAVLLTEENLKCTDIWIGKEYGVPDLASFSYSDGRSLKKGDTVLIKYSAHIYPPDSPMQKVEKPAYKDPPFHFKTPALIGYMIGNKTRYIPVERFRTLPPQKYM